MKENEAGKILEDRLQSFLSHIGSLDFILGPMRKIQVFYDPEVILIEQLLRKFNSGFNVESRLVVVQI